MSRCRAGRCAASSIRSRGWVRGSTREPGGLPPLRIHGRQTLRGIDYTLPVASAQVKSAILLAGLYAHGETRVTEPHPTRDYTERMLRGVRLADRIRAGWAQLDGGHRLRATDVVVPADFSSAAFFLVAATLTPGSELLLRDVGMNPRRTGLLHALRAMGADIREDEPARTRRRSGRRPARAPCTAARHRRAGRTCRRT